MASIENVNLLFITSNNCFLLNSELGKSITSNSRSVLLRRQELMGERGKRIYTSLRKRKRTSPEHSVRLHREEGALKNKTTP